METRSRIDILSLFLYFSIAIIGIASVYSATYEDGSMTLLDGRSGKQIMWFGVSLFVGIIIFFLNANFFEVFSWYFYVPLMLLLVVVLFIGTDINGARSWIKIGSFSLQPSEFAKYGAAFAVSSVLSYIDFSFNKRYDVIKLFAVIAFPAILIVIQGDTGSALVFASFILVFYREGLTPLLLVLGIVAIFIFVLTLVIGFSYFAITTLVLFLVFNAFTYTNKKMLIPSLSIMAVVVLFSLSVQFLFNNVLQKHQQKRIQVTLNLIEDNQGAGYNVNQSKIFAKEVFLAKVF